MALRLISANWLPLNCAWKDSRTAFRVSVLAMSSATAFTSGVAWASCLASSSAQPLDIDSCSRLQSPPGSAAVIAMLATTGLATRRDHSSEVKLDLFAMVGPPDMQRVGHTQA